MCKAKPNDALVVDEEEEENDENDENDENENGEHDRIIRAKWAIDGARTLEEAAVKLERFAAYLRNMHTEGWELRSAVDDDYGFVYNVAPPSSSGAITT